MDTEAHTIKEDENIVTCTGRTPGALIIAGILFAYGALVLAIILCTNVLSEGVVALLILLFGDIFMIGEGVWFVLYWKNKKIIMSDSQIVYYSLTGRMWTYSWSEVRSARCIAGARGGVTIQIRTADRRFRMESGLMKGCAGAEKMLEEKGFLKNLNRAEF